MKRVCVDGPVFDSRAVLTPRAEDARHFSPDSARINLHCALRVPDSSQLPRGAMFDWNYWLEFSANARTSCGFAGPRPRTG